MIETVRLSWHVTRRNWVVYKKNFIANISPTLADPAFFILSLGVGLGGYVTQIDGKTYVQFLAPGLVASTALMTSFFESSYGFFVRMVFEGIFKAMLTTPIGVREIILGEFIWVAIKGAVMALGVALVLMAFGLVTDPKLLVLIPFIGGLMALPCGAFGLIATSYVRNIDQFQTVYSFFISPLFFFSGIFFPLWQMPEPMQWAAKALPLSHGVILVQAVFWNERVVESFLTNGSVLVVQSIALCVFAYYRTKIKLIS